MAMEVDAGTIVCYNCFKEGHMKRECTNAKQPWRRVNVKSGTKPPPGRTAFASQGNIPCVEKSVERKVEEERPEFEQGSSKGKGKADPRDDMIAAMQKQMADMQVAMTKLLDWGF